MKNLFNYALLTVVTLYCCNSGYGQYHSIFTKDQSGNTVLKSQSELQSELNSSNNSSGQGNNPVYNPTRRKSRTDIELEKWQEEQANQGQQRKAKKAEEEQENYLRHNFQTFKEGNKYGLKNERGMVMLMPRYDAVLSPDDSKSVIYYYGSDNEDRFFKSDDKWWFYSGMNDNLDVERGYDSVRQIDLLEDGRFHCTYVFLASSQDHDYLIYINREDDTTYETHIKNIIDDPFSVYFKTLYLPRLAGKFGMRTGVALSPYVYTMKKNEKWGLFDLQKQQWAMPPKYDSIEVSRDNPEVALVTVKSKMGMVNSQNHHEFISPLFDDIKRTASPDFFLLQSKHRWGLYDTKKGFVLNVEYNQINEEASTGLFLVEKNDQWGLYSTSKGFLLAVGYSKIKEDSTTRLFLVKKGTAWGLYDENKGILGLPAMYDNLYFDSEKYLWVATTKGTSSYFKTNDYSKINIESQNLQPLVIDAYHHFLLEKRGNKTDIIADKWKFKGCNEVEIWHYMLLAKKDDKWYNLGLNDGSIINTWEKEPQLLSAEIPGQSFFGRPTTLGDQVYLTRNDGKYGLICFGNFANDIHLDCVYDSIAIIYQGNVPALDVKVMDFEPEFGENYKIEGISLKKNGKYGSYIFRGSYTSPSRQIECSYDSGFVFLHPNTFVKQNGKFGLLNWLDKLIIPCEYDFVDFVSNTNYFAMGRMEGNEVVYQASCLDYCSYDANPPAKMKIPKFRKAYPQSAPYQK